MLAYVTRGKSPVSVLTSKPILDRVESEALGRRLFPRFEPVSDYDGTLDWTCPLRGDALVGCFQGLSIIATDELARDTRNIPERFLSAAEGRDIYLHTMISTVDWFSFAVWRDGNLVRFLSVAPDSGIEEHGERMEFELPFWAGRFPLEEGEDYPLPFHPLEMGEVALQTFFGYCREGGPVEFIPEVPLFDASLIKLPRFRRTKPWWKFW